MMLILTPLTSGLIARIAGAKAPSTTGPIAGPIFDISLEIAHNSKTYALIAIERGVNRGQF